MYWCSKKRDNCKEILIFYNHELTILFRDSSPKKLHVSAFGDSYHMELSQAESALLPKAQIVTRNGDTEEVWTGPRPDCFLTGKLTSQNGIASFSNCDRLVNYVSSCIISILWLYHSLKFNLQLWNKHDTCSFSIALCPTFTQKLKYFLSKLFFPLMYQKICIRAAW